MSKLMPPDGSPRRLTGYATYAFGYGNAFFIVLDSNIATDAKQLDVGDQPARGTESRALPARLRGLPPSAVRFGRSTAATFSSQRRPAIRAVYLPAVSQAPRAHDDRRPRSPARSLRRTVRRRRTTYRMDHLVSGGGGAPTYTYRGEPDLEPYLQANAAQNVRIEHLLKPGPLVEDNPHHFLDRPRRWRRAVPRSRRRGTGAVHAVRPPAGGPQLKTRIEFHVARAARPCGASRPAVWRRTETSPRWRARHAPDEPSATS